MKRRRSILFSVEKMGSCWAGLLFLLTSLSLTACQSVLSKSHSDIKQFHLQGRVEYIDQKNSGLTVAHEDIPGFMPAMSMLFKVKDKAVLQQLAIGDHIKAVLSYNQQTRETWLQDIVINQKNRGEK